MTVEAGEVQPGESYEPMNAMRRGIAEHMRRSLDTAAHVTSAIEVDMSKVVAIREKLKPEIQKSYGVNVTYLAFVARASVETLRDWPWVITDESGNDAISIRPIMNITLTYDHRLVDGAYAGGFLQELREKLESWGESDY